MKKRFDGKLYIEGLRQLRTMGSVFLVLMMLEAVLIPVWRLVDSIQRGTAPSVLYSNYNLDLFTLHPASFLLFVLVIPVMTLSLFSFLNRRADSDFYHSMPQTRTCLYVSFLASVMTWVLVIQWITLLVDMFLHSILLGAGIMTVGRIFFQSLSIDIICLLVAGAILLSMSITGNIFGNVILTGIILFLPRLFMLLIQLGVGATLTVVSTVDLVSFMDNSWNLLTGLIYGVVDSGADDIRTNFISGQAMIYTLILAVVYLVLGCLLFNRRRSETAGQTSCNTLVERVLCLAPALVFSMIPTMMVFDNIIYGEYMDITTVYSYFILYLISVILFFLFELITTRKMSRTLRAIPYVVILFVLDAAMIGGMISLRNSVLEFEPRASEISQVTFDNGDRYLYAGEDNTLMKGYFSQRMNEVVLDDSEILEIVAHGLQNANARDKRDYTVYDSDLAYSMQAVTILCNGKTYQRNILLYSSEQRKVAETLAGNDQVKEIYMNLPSIEDENLTTFNYELTEEESLQIYAALLQDAEEMGFEDWYAYCSESDYVSYLSVRDGITYEAASDGYTWVSSLIMIYNDEYGATACNFPVTTATPRAARTYMELVRCSEEELKETKEVIEKSAQYKDQFEENGYAYVSGDIYQIIGEEIQLSGNIVLDIIDDEEREWLIALLDAQSQVPEGGIIEGTWVYVTISVDYYNLENYISQSLEGAFYIPEELMGAVTENMYNN